MAKKNVRSNLRRLILPSTWTGCILGAIAVVAICYGCLSLRDYLPENADSYLALGIPLVGGAGLLFYFYRMVYYIPDDP